MRIRTRKNVLLIELIIVILFFAVSAAITLQVYSMAHIRSQDSGDLTYALMAAQDWSDRLSLSEDPEGLLLEGGWALEKGGYTFAPSSGYEMELSMEREAMPAGTMTLVTISVFNAAREDRPLILTLPSEVYAPSAGVGG